MSISFAQMLDEAADSAPRAGDRIAKSVAAEYDRRHSTMPHGNGSANRYTVRFGASRPVA
jgi:hypothetical protein